MWGATFYFQQNEIICAPHTLLLYCSCYRIRVKCRHIRNLFFSLAKWNTKSMRCFNSRLKCSVFCLFVCWNGELAENFYDWTICMLDACFVFSMPCRTKWILNNSLNSFMILYCNNGQKNCKHKIEIVIETMLWTPSSNKLKISYLFYCGVVAKYQPKLTQKQ